MLWVLLQVLKWCVCCFYGTRLCCCCCFRLVLTAVVCAFCLGQTSSKEEMKYVLVTGGVVSGLGKGVTASSIGLLLQACGLRVTSIKIGILLLLWIRVSPFQSHFSLYENAFLCNFIGINKLPLHLFQPFMGMHFY